jgi:leucyl aminopeptidase
MLGGEKGRNEQMEGIRQLGASANKMANELKMKTANYLSTFEEDMAESLAFLEGFYLSNYQFLKYKTVQMDKIKNSFQSLHIASESAGLNELIKVCESVFVSRNLVNEPLSFLTAVQFSSEMVELCEREGISVTVFGKEKIERLGMGGVISVNLGSIKPPTFNILEYKSKEAKNSKPIVLVGKGVVYDTGGLSLKPTANSMDFMKSDMAGAAAVVGILLAIAKNKLPFHIIGLIPCVENRPGMDAMVPGDVITMYDGTTVEVLNTDAEGRLILADALAYAKQYEPELVLDFATLTGAAVAAIGTEGIVFMGTADDKTKVDIKNSGEVVCERLVEFPLWSEYGEQIESKIADLKNLGGPYAGAITAGKFLEKFTDYPWLHFDIAGPSYLHKPTNYRGAGGTGVGVRLIFDYIKNYKG